LYPFLSGSDFHVLFGTTRISAFEANVSFPANICEVTALTINGSEIRCVIVKTGNEFPQGCEHFLDDFRGNGLLWYFRSGSDARMEHIHTLCILVKTNLKDVHHRDPCGFPFRHPSKGFLDLVSAIAAV
jgi:hypothetical protein